MAATLSNLQKCLVSVLLASAAVMLVLAVILDGYYCGNAPRIPQPSDGRVYRDIVCHGSDVYLTRTEYVGQWLILPLMLASGGTGIYLLNRLGRRKEF